MPIIDRLTATQGLAPGPGYAHAVTVTGRLAFISGQVALDADGGLVGAGDLAAQTRQALGSLHRVLRGLGADWPDPSPAPSEFALSESPRFAGRAVAALASDPGRARWNQKSVTSGQLASEYGFTDVDGSRPDVWRFIEAVREPGVSANLDDYR
jgi:hypothetical protein